jgi:hypothetical protein
MKTKSGKAKIGVGQKKAVSHLQRARAEARNTEAGRRRD